MHYLGINNGRQPDSLANHPEMLPLFHRKKDSLKTAPAVEVTPAVTDEWVVPSEEEITGKRATKAESVAEVITVGAIDAALNVLQVEKEAVVNDLVGDPALTDISVSEPEQVNANEMNQFLTRLEALELAMEELKMSCHCRCKRLDQTGIVVEVSRALDLMHDIFSTGMAYQQRIITRVCDELCDLVEK